MFKNILRESAMPYSQEHKQKSRAKILASAARLFAGKGYDNVGIDEVMADAGMTRGAFYAHFGSKNELYTKAVLSAATKSRIARHFHDRENDLEALEQMLDGYLSHAHVQQKTAPCPLAFLASDVANRDKSVRSAYTKVCKGLSKTVEKLLEDESNETAKEKALAITTLMVGGVAIGRALNDRKSADTLLDACRKTAMSLAVS
ncbi:MAG: TetR/AcrR family transcriptional regulator [Candidatus Sedimenticola sp. 20ELBAFRAG]